MEENWNEFEDIEFGDFVFEGIDHFIEKVERILDIFLIKHFGITLKGDDRVIGIISVSDGIPEDHVGYILSSEYQGNGYMTEALKAVCKSYFEATSHDRIMCQIRRDNLPSRRVAEKCGFVQDPDQKEWALNYYHKPLDDFYLYDEKEIMEE